MVTTVNYTIHSRILSIRSIKKEGINDLAIFSTIHTHLPSKYIKMYPIISRHPNNLVHIAN